MGGREVYQNTRFFGGISLEYIELTEFDFIASPGSAYTPPERGDYRRIAGSRQIQLLMDAPGVVETKQLSAVELFLPANTILDSTNDAGNGRLFYLKNSGTGNVVIKDYLGNTLWTIREFGIVIVVGNDNGNWDFYFTAKNIAFEPVAPITATNVQDAIVQANIYAEGFPRAGIRSTYNGTVGNNTWLGPNELLSNTPLAIFPVNVRINEITWANKKTDRQFRIEFRRGSRTGAIVYTLVAESPNPGYGYAIGINVEFAAGETLHAQYLDDGNNCSDMDLVVWISRIN